MESFHRSFGLPVTIVRPFNTYGPRQSARAVVPTIVSQALAMHEIRLGDLRPIRDLTFVKDTARAFMAIAGCDAALGQTVNAGTGKGISIGDLAALILEILGKQLPVVADEERVRPEKSEVLKLLCDNRLASELMGWAPTTSLRSGLAEVIRFIESNPGLYKPALYAR